MSSLHSNMRIKQFLSLLLFYIGSSCYGQNPNQELKLINCLPNEKGLYYYTDEPIDCDSLITVTFRCFSTDVVANYILNPSECKDVLYRSKLDTNIIVLDLRPDASLLKKCKKDWRFVEHPFIETSNMGRIEFASENRISIPVSVFGHVSSLRGLTKYDILNKKIIVLISALPEIEIDKRSRPKLSIHNCFNKRIHSLVNYCYSLFGDYYPSAVPYDYKSALSSIYKQGLFHLDILLYRENDYWFSIKRDNGKYELRCGYWGDFNTNVIDISSWPGISICDSILLACNDHDNDLEELTCEPLSQGLLVWSDEGVFTTYRRLGGRYDLDVSNHPPLLGISKDQQDFLDNMMKFTREFVAQQ